MKKLIWALHAFAVGLTAALYAFVPASAFAEKCGGNELFTAVAVTAFIAGMIPALIFVRNTCRNTAAGMAVCCLIGAFCCSVFSAATGFEGGWRFILFLYFYAALLGLCAGGMGSLLFSACDTMPELKKAVLYPFLAGIMTVCAASTEVTLLKIGDYAGCALWASAFPLFTAVLLPFAQEGAKGWRRIVFASINLFLAAGMLFFVSKISDIADQVESEFSFAESKHESLPPSPYVSRTQVLLAALQTGDSAPENICLKVGKGSYLPEHAYVLSGGKGLAILDRDMAPRFMMPSGREKRFGLVMLELPPPESIGSSRLYSLENFMEIKKYLLAEDGVVAVVFPAPEEVGDYVSICSATASALKKCFSKTLFAGGGMHMIFASDSATLTLDAEELGRRAQRFSEKIFLPPALFDVIAPQIDPECDPLARRASAASATAKPARDREHGIIGDALRAGYEKTASPLLRIYDMLIRFRWAVYVLFIAAYCMLHYAKAYDSGIMEGFRLFDRGFYITALVCGTLYSSAVYFPSESGLAAAVFAAGIFAGAVFGASGRIKSILDSKYLFALLPFAVFLPCILPPCASIGLPLYNSVICALCGYLAALALQGERTDVAVEVSTHRAGRLFSGSLAALVFAVLELSEDGMIFFVFALSACAFLTKGMENAKKTVKK